MKTRNLLIRLDSDTLRFGRAWIREHLATPASPQDVHARRLVEALDAIQDAGDLAGTAFALDETSDALESAPGAAQEAAGDPDAPAPASDLPKPPAKART